MKTFGSVRLRAVKCVCSLNFGASRGNSIDEGRFFIGSGEASSQFGGPALEIGVWIGTLEGEGRELGDANDEVMFEGGGTAWIAAVNCESAEEGIVGRENCAGGENFQAVLECAEVHRAGVNFASFGERDDGDDVPDADIDHHAKFVKDAGERGAERDQIKDLARERSLMMITSLLK